MAGKSTRNWWRYRIRITRGPSHSRQAWCRIRKLFPLLELIQRADLVVEAAGQLTLSDFVPRAFAAGRDILVMSVGGLLGREEWFRQAEEKGCRNLRAVGRNCWLGRNQVSVDGKVTVRHVDEPQAVGRAAWHEICCGPGTESRKLQEETVIFEGTAEDAARAFPTTSNVAASLRLAVDREVPVCVRIVAVPGGNKNVHEIRAYGEFGRLSVDVENVPSKANPRTSQLAAFSALATLKNLTRAVRVGT